MHNILSVSYMLCQNSQRFLPIISYSEEVQPDRSLLEKMSFACDYNRMSP
jgi:hypothetical protein